MPVTHHFDDHEVEFTIERGRAIKLRRGEKITKSWSFECDKCELRGEGFRIYDDALSAARSLHEGNDE